MFSKVFSQLGLIQKRHFDINIDMDIKGQGNQDKLTNKTI